MAFRHEGFWRPMDTLKDRQVLEDMVERGKMPWRSSKIGPAVAKSQQEVWMKLVCLARPGEPLSILCIGAHSDDIEIGAGGTILSWIARGVRLMCFGAC